MHQKLHFLRFCPTDKIVERRKYRAAISTLRANEIDDVRFLAGGGGGGGDDAFVTRSTVCRN